VLLGKVPVPVPVPVLLGMDLPQERLLGKVPVLLGKLALVWLHLHWHQPISLVCDQMLRPQLLRPWPCEINLHLEG
jgi:hypothetical protein